MAAVLAIPFVVGSGLVRTEVEAALTRELGVTARVGKISGGLFSPFRVDDLELTLPEGEFEGSRLLSLHAAELSPGLVGWLQGPERIDVTVHSLVATVEGRAGGRTSIDAILRELMPDKTRDVADPPPDAKPARVPAAIPEIHIAVRESRLEVRVLPYQPPARRVHVFREDPPIRGVDEGRRDYALELAQLDVQMSSDGVAFRVDGAFQDGETSSAIVGDGRIRDGEVDGALRVENFDLAIVNPFLREPIAGLVSLYVEGAHAPGASQAKVGFRVEGLRVSSLQEEWMEGAFELAEDATTIHLERIDLKSASGRFATNGQLRVSKAEPMRPSGKLEGTLALEPIAELISGRHTPGPARVRFLIDADLHTTGGRMRGEIYGDHLTSETAAEEIALKFMLRGDRVKRRLMLDSFALRADYARVDLQGEVQRGEEFEARFEGDASGDLDRLRALLEPLVPELADVVLRGQGSARFRQLRWATPGTLDLTIEAGFERLFIGRAGAEPSEFIDVLGSFDGTFREGFDQLAIRRLAVQDLEVSGELRGLRAHASMPAGELDLNGSLLFSRRLTRMLRLDDFKDPNGYIQLRARLDSDGQRIATSGTTRMSGLAFRLGDVPYEDSDIEGRWDLDWTPERVAGKANFKGSRFLADARQLFFFPATKIFRVEGKARLEDVEILRRTFLPDWTWSGAHEADVTYEWTPSGQSIDGRVEAPAWTFGYGDRGVRNEPTQVKARIRSSGATWRFDGTKVRMPERALEIVADELRFEGGAAEMNLRATTLWEELHDQLPVLAEQGVEGPLSVDFRCSLGATDGFDVVARSETLEFMGRPLAGVQFSAPGVQLGETIRVPRFALSSSDGVKIEGEADIDRTLRLKANTAGADFGPLAGLHPQLEGSGPYDLDLEAVVPIADPTDDYTVQVDGRIASMRIAKFAGKGIAFQAVSRFRLRASDVEDLRLEGKVSTDRTRSPGIDWRDVRFDYEGRGSLRADRGGPGHAFTMKGRAGSMRLGERRFEEIQLGGNGTFHHTDLARDDVLSFDGDLAFRKLPAIALDWTNGSARVSMRERVVRLQDLRARVKGGAVRGKASIDLRAKETPWSVQMEFKDAKLDRGFTDPLSFILPILRLSGKRESATGLVSARIDVRADGTDWSTIKTSLRGGGNLQLENAEIQGSLLLPLLSLRVGKLLTNKPYSIPDSTMKWSVRNGVVTTEPLELNGRPFPIKLGGTVTLDGELDYIVHPGLLLVPLRVSGKWGKVRVLPAPSEALPKWPFSK